MYNRQGHMCGRRAAWSALGALPGREARLQYVQLVQRLLPDWRAAEPARGGGGPAGAVFSAPVHAAEDERAGDERALVRDPRRSTWCWGPPLKVGVGGCAPACVVVCIGEACKAFLGQCPRQRIGVGCYAAACVVGCVQLKSCTAILGQCPRHSAVTCCQGKRRHGFRRRAACMSWRARATWAGWRPRWRPARLWMPATQTAARRCTGPPTRVMCRCIVALLAFKCCNACRSIKTSCQHLNGTIQCILTSSLIAPMWSCHWREVRGRELEHPFHTVAIMCAQHEHALVQTQHSRLRNKGILDAQKASKTAHAIKRVSWRRWPGCLSAMEQT